jgi:cell division protein FtsB
MSNVRGRRGGSPAEGHRVSGRVSRATGRAPRVHSTRPVGTNLRASATSRPGARRSGRRAGRSTAGTAQRRRPLVTGRAVVLGGVILLLALTLAGPIRQYLAGQAELEQLAAEGRDLDQRAAELRQQLQQQSDPGYAERQARERLAYVLPGDRLVVVVDGEAVEGDAGTLTSAGRDAAPPWYEGLMQSLADADG